MKISREELRLMIQEAIRLGYGDRYEFYGGKNRAMDVDEEDLDPEDDVLGLRFMGSNPYSIDDADEYGDAMDADIDLYPSDDLSALEREMSRQGRMPPHHHDDDYSDLDLDALLREGKKPSRQELEIAADDVARTLEILSKTVNRLFDMEFGTYNELIYREAGDSVASLQQVMAAVKHVRDSTPQGYRDDIGTRLDQYSLDQKRLARKTSRGR